MNARNLEVGVCSWSLLVSSLPELESLLGRVGTGVVQLALGDPRHATWEEGDELFSRVREVSFAVSATMIGFPGEDYTTPGTIERTGGFGDPALRAERLDIFRWAVDRTVDVGVELLTTHGGFIPEPGDPGRTDFLDCLCEALDYAEARGVTLALETGQESAELLRRTIDELEAPNLKVNFDPANMILYGREDPIHAVEILGPDIAHVHVKDGRAPEKEGEWGEEVPLGEGEVGMRAYIEALVVAGYTGPLIIEREVGTQEERIRDVASGVALLKRLAQEV